MSAGGVGRFVRVIGACLRAGCRENALLVGVLAHESGAAGGEVVDGADHLDGARLDKVASLGAVRKQVLDAAPDIGLDGGVDERLVREARPAGADPLDGGDDVVDERGDGAVDLGALHHRRDGAAGGVPHHHHERSVQVPDAVLDGPDLVGVRDIARDADDKEIAEAAIEEPLDGDARVRAGEDGGEGMLPVVARVTQPRGSGVGGFGGARDEAGVALAEQNQRLIGVRGGRVARRPRQRKGREGDRQRQ